MKKKNLYIILYISAILLLIPVIAMQFTNEVNWNLMDFIIAGVLFFGIGILIDLVFRKIKNTKYRILLLIAILVLFIVLWAELAVGILGTPWSGK